MKLSAVLAARLADLTQALDEPGTDIEETLQRLAADAAAATTSFAGLSASVRVAGRSLTITVLDSVAAEDVGASLRIPLTSTDGASGDAHVILYALRPGAFVDLAADLSWLAGLPLSALVLGADIADLPARLEMQRLSADHLIDQAAGVLIAQGMTVEQAYAELARRAALDGGSRVSVARDILNALDEDPA